MRQVPFNRAYATGVELEYIADAIRSTHLSGNGPFTKRCAEWLEQRVGVPRALMTHSCTGALEMAAVLVGIGPGDEVIMPSFTFVSTANAVVAHGGIPVFVDVREDTLNLDESKVEAAITRRTRAIIAVHYAGVACELDALHEIARANGLALIEDAAQAVLATYHGRELGGIGDVGALSFHETKSVMCGEGGALLVNHADWVDRAEVIHEKGTDRRRFLQGQVDKYTWQEFGSSYPMSDLTAASGLSSKPPRTSLSDGWPSGGHTTKASPTSRRANACDDRSSRLTVCTTRTCTTWCFRKDATVTSSYAISTNGASTPSSTTSHCTLRRPASAMPAPPGISR